MTLAKIPTNIITGFLGVGKTTAILHLLKHKPETERWAVLVNEFGEIGVDGSLMAGQQHSIDRDIFIREVPGGCMCCAAGLPMQIALNQLLAKAKPDRLLIEPTGLGHPKEVLQVLNEDFNRNVLDIQKSITLVDARKLSDKRYTHHETFNQQIDIADVIVGNKQDCYQYEDEERLREYVRERRGKDVEVVFTSQGQLDQQLLDGPSSIVSTFENDHHHHSSAADIEEVSLSECGYIKVQNIGEGFESIGWRFSADIIFQRNALFSWLSGLQVERMKAVFITADGIFAYNLADDILTEMELDEVLESRVEIIATQIKEEWHSEILHLAGITEN